MESAVTPACPWAGWGCSRTVDTLLLGLRVPRPVRLILLIAVLAVSASVPALVAPATIKPSILAHQVLMGFHFRSLSRTSTTMPQGPRSSRPRGRRAGWTSSVATGIAAPCGAEVTRRAVAAVGNLWAVPAARGQGLSAAQQQAPVRPGEADRALPAPVPSSTRADGVALADLIGEDTDGHRGAWQVSPQDVAERHKRVDRNDLDLLEPGRGPSSQRPYRRPRPPRERSGLAPEASRFAFNERSDSDSSSGWGMAMRTRSMSPSGVAGCVDTNEVTNQ